ncbi:MAG: Arabinose efflux permease family protein [Novosphingobium sp.]|nr:Arabinose efflux permease family protein [Novosphingobium sp.]
MEDAAPSATREWRSHWPMVLAGTLGMSFYSLFSYSQQMFIEPLEREFGWPRAEISLGYTILAFTAFFFGPVIGMVIDRHGARRVAIPGTLLAAAAFAALGLTGSSLWQWYALWFLLALVALGVKSTVWSVAVSGAFTAGRGMALALMLCGSAIAQFVGPILTNWLIETHGWRAAYIYLGLGWGGLAFVVVVFFFRSAQPRAGGSEKKSATTAHLPGLTFKQAMRNPIILRIYAANLFSALVGSGISFHLYPILTETGLKSTGAALLASLAGIGGIFGKLLTGWLLDRFQGNTIPVLSFAVAAVAYFLLLNSFHSAGAVAAGVFILGYSSGAGLGVTTYLISRYGGLRAFGTIYGTLGSMLMLGSGIGPPLAGLVHDRTGSYSALLLTAIPVVLVFSLLFVGLGRYPDFAVPKGEADKAVDPAAPMPSSI